MTSNLDRSIDPIPDVDNTNALGPEMNTRYWAAAIWLLGNWNGPLAILPRLIVVVIQSNIDMFYITLKQTICYVCSNQFVIKNSIFCCIHVRKIDIWRDTYSSTSLWFNKIHNIICTGMDTDWRMNIFLLTLPKIYFMTKQLLWGT